MPFKETIDGMTHHDKDSCFKCKMCGNHFFREDQIQTHLCVDVETLKKWAKEGDDMQGGDFKEQADNNDLTNK